MANKLLLFSDTHLPTKSENIVWADTKNKTVTQLLNLIEDEQPKGIFVYSELIWNVSDRSLNQGLDLIKHIRLTPLKDDLQNIPIVFLHWLPIEDYIEIDIENLMLFSSGIKRCRLPLDIDSIELPSKLNDKIIPFMSLSNKDEQMSEHIFRNEIAITQFKNDITTNTNDFRNKPLWYKKLFLSQGYKINKSDNINNHFNGSFNILLIDDLADKWKPALLNILPNSIVEECKTLEKAYDKISKLKQSATERRIRFKNETANLIELSNTLEEKKEDLKGIKNSLNAANASIKAAFSNKEKEIELIEKCTNELRLLLNTSSNNNLIEILIDFQSSDVINTTFKEQAIQLSKLITEISNSKVKIQSIDNLILETQKRIETFRKTEEYLTQEISSYESQRKAKSKIVKSIFESLNNSEYDVVLLDMHLSKDSEGQIIEKTDGYSVLKTINDSDLKISTAIFSATTKNLEKVKREFTFLNKKHFLKGITPPSELIQSLIKLGQESQINKMIQIIEELIGLSVPFQQRVYEAYDSSLFETIPFNTSRRNEINRELLKIKSDLEKIHQSNTNVSMLSIVATLGKIIREFRFTVNNPDRQNSLFSKSNSTKNKINSRYCDLIFYRNKIEHPPVEKWEKDRFNDWLNKLDIQYIESHFELIYNGLLFDE